jgi:hypothetical protein
VNSNWKYATTSLTICALVACVVGCESRNPNWKETIPVTGQVYADGQPAEGVQVTFHPVEGMDTAQPTETKSMTDEAGRFAASTYEVGDGVPEGEYQLTFVWGKLNMVSMTFDGDKFKGKYKDPKKSEVSVSVVSGSPVDLGRIDLRTK